MKTRSLNLAGIALAALGAAVAYMAGAFDPLFHLLGIGGDPAMQLFMLANGVAAAGVPKKTVAERIAEFEAKRLELVGQKQAIVQKAVVDEGRTIDAHEAEQDAELDAQIKSIDDTVKVLKAHEATMVSSQSTAVDTQTAGRESTGGIEVRGGIVTVKRNLPPGIRFTRFAIAMACAKGNIMQANEIAKVRFKDTPEVANALQAAVHMGSTVYLNEKAAVAAGTTTDSAWAGPLVQYNDMESEFIGLLRPKTILGRMNELHQVPFNVRMARQLTGVSGSFVGEGAPKPVGRQTYNNETLGFAKAAVIVVMTDELVRFSSPNAEVRARDDMIKGIAQYLDARFIDPSYSGVAGVSPASITNAARRVQMGGVTVAAFDAAVAAAMADFTTSNVDPATAVWVMSPAIALKLALMRNTDGSKVYPGITMNGGTWYDLPVITSSSASSSGSPGEQQIALVTQDEVLFADDGGIAIDMSTEASVQMNDAPQAGAQSLVSLWQNNLIGIRAERYINWKPRRASSLGTVLIENVNL